MSLGNTLPLTRGPLVTFYGKKELLDEIPPGAPGKSISVLFVSSLMFQILLILLKWIHSRKIRNYELKLKAIIMNNFLNIYTTLITILISVLGCFYSIYHYNNLLKDLREDSDISEVGTPSENQIPDDLLLLYLLTLLAVLLPYSQNFGLRSIFSSFQLF